MHAQIVKCILKIKNVVINAIIVCNFLQTRKGKNLGGCSNAMLYCL